MLEFLRKKRHSLLGFIVAGFASLMMLGFGIDAFFSGSSENIAIRIGEKEITYREYAMRLDRVSDLYRRQLRENFSRMRAMLNLEQQTIDGIITENILEDFTDQLGLSASNQQIEQNIRQQVISIPQLGGEFTQASYKNFLRAVGISGAGLEFETRKQIIQDQLRKTLSDLSFADKNELLAVYNEENAKSQFRYLNISADDFADKVDTSKEEELKDFFLEEQEAYRKPRTIQYSLVEFKHSEFEDHVEITKNDLEIAYQEHSSKFVEPAKVLLRQIFFKKSQEDKDPNNLEELITGSSSEDSEAASELKPNEFARNKANLALERVDAGDDFAEVAKEVSEDSTTASKGGEMGWLSFDSLEPALRKAAKLLDPGQNSNVIETDSGFHILMAEELQPKRQKEQSEIEDELRAIIRRTESPQYAYAEAETFEQLWEKETAGGAGSLASFAEKHKRNVISSEKLLTAKEGPGVLPASITAKLIDLSEGDSLLFEQGASVFLAQIDKTKDSYIPEFETVKEQVTKDFVAKKSIELAREFAESLNNSEKDLAALAEENGLELKTTELKKKSEANGEPFNTPNLRQAAYGLSPERKRADEAFVTGNNFVVVELMEKQLPSTENFEKELPSLRAQEQQKSGERMLNALIEHLKAKTDIWVNPNLLNSQPV
ncbi:hypothetical protein BVY02_00745 [bacterium J17]|nr:hypothetical protein BVY02_00745 [bacterium J17]